MTPPSVGVSEVYWTSRPEVTSDPWSAPMINSAATIWVNFFKRDLDQAAQSLRRTKELDRTFAMGRLYGSWALLLAGRGDCEDRIRLQNEKAMQDDEAGLEDELARVE